MTKAKEIIKQTMGKKLIQLEFWKTMEGKYYIHKEWKDWEEARNYSKQLKGEIKELLEALGE